MNIYHTPLKIRTDDGRSRIRELRSIGIYNIFITTLTNVVHLLQDFVYIVPQT